MDADPHDHVHYDPFLGSGAEIYVFTVTLLLAIFAFSIVVLLIYSINKHPEVALSINFPTIISAILYCISSVVFLCVVAFFDGNDKWNLEHDESFVSSVLCFVLFYALAKQAIYAQFFVRLYSGFSGSVLQLNRCTIVTFCTLLGLQLIAVVWGILLVALRNITLHREYRSYYGQLFFVFICLFLFDLCLSWMLVGLFTSKLFRSVMFRSHSEFFQRTSSYWRPAPHRAAASKAPEPNKQNSVPSQESAPEAIAETRKQAMSSSLALSSSQPHRGDDGDDRTSGDDGAPKVAIEATTNDAKDGVSNAPNVETKPHNPHQLVYSADFMIDLAYASIDESDRKSLDVVTRNFLLSTSSVITAQLCYVSFVVLLATLRRNTDFNPKTLLTVYGGIFYPIDVVLSCLSLYLNYNFAAKYYRCLCRCCHDRCGVCVARQASTKILRKQSVDVSCRNMQMKKDASADN